MIFLNPFFWAFMSMFGMTMAVGLWGSPGKLGKFPVVFSVVTLTTVGRIVLPLPFISQARPRPVMMAILGGAAAMIRIGNDF